MSADKKESDTFKLMKWFHNIEEQNETVKDWIKKSILSGDIESAEKGRRRLKNNIEKMREIVGFLNKKNKP